MYYLLNICPAEFEVFSFKICSKLSSSVLIELYLLFLRHIQNLPFKLNCIVKIVLWRKNANSTDGTILWPIPISYSMLICNLTNFLFPLVTVLHMPFSLVKPGLFCAVNLFQVVPNKFLTSMNNAFAMHYAIICWCLYKRLSSAQAFLILGPGPIKEHLNCSSGHNF